MVWMCWEAEMVASAGRLDVGCEKNRVQGDVKVFGLSDRKGTIDVPWGGVGQKSGEQVRGGRGAGVWVGCVSEAPMGHPSGGEASCR